MRLVLLAVVLGIALMHHLGGAPDSGPGCAGPMASTAEHTVHAVHAVHADLPAPHVGVPGPAEVDGMVHPCLAILVAGAALLVHLLLGGLPTPPAPLCVPRRAPGGRRSRAPPVPRRLALLQVLRV